MLHPNGHGAEEIPHSQSRAMTESEEPLLGERGCVAIQDLGVVDAHGVVRMEIPVVRCDGEQRQRRNGGQKHAMLAVDVRVRRELGGFLLFAGVDQLTDILLGRGRADIRCSCPSPPPSLNSDGGIPLPLSSMEQLPRG